MGVGNLASYSSGQYPARRRSPSALLCSRHVKKVDQGSSIYRLLGSIFAARETVYTVYIQRFQDH